MDMSNYPALKSLIEDVFVPDEMERRHMDVDDDLENFNERFNTSFEDVDAAHDWIDTESADVDDIDITNIVYDIETFASIIDNTGHNSDAILAEFYKNQVFAIWHEYWANQGIEETRDVAQNIYDHLEEANSSNISDLIVAVNAGLNAVHQTGDMIDYLEDDVGEEGMKSLLSNLSDGDFVEEANKELRMVGVKI